MRSRTQNAKQVLVRGCTALLLGGAIILLQGCSSSGGSSVSTGGTPGSAGTTALGGNATGGSPTPTAGATTPTGGSVADTGGSIPVGGSTTEGGGTITSSTVETGGATSAAGATKSGGVTSAAGATKSGGATSPGGATSSGGVTTTGGATPIGGTPNPGAGRYMEKLTRGLVAVKSGSGYFLSWRLFGTEAGSDIAFNVYRGTTKLNASPITNATNYQDTAGGTTDYSVKAVVGGQEQAASAVEHVMAQNYISIPLQNSSGYTAGDASTGDLDGDG